MILNCSGVRPVFRFVGSLIREIREIRGQEHKLGNFLLSLLLDDHSAGCDTFRARQCRYFIYFPQNVQYMLLTLYL